MNYRPSIKILLLLSMCSLTSSKWDSRSIWKCCPETQMLNSTSNQCVNHTVLQGRSKKHEVYSRSQVAFKTNSSIMSLMNDDVFREITNFLRNGSLKFGQIGPGPPCEYHMGKVIDATDIDYVLLHNGSLLYKPQEGKNTIYDPRSFCIETQLRGTSKSNTVYVICPFLNKKCVKQCCLPGNSLIPNLKGDTWQCSVNESGKGEVQFHCSVDRLQPSERDNLILKYGVRYGNHTDDDCYCLYISSESVDVSETKVCNQIIFNLKAEYRRVYKYLLPFSLIFSVLTLMVFAFIPNIRTMKSNMVICQIVSLLIIDICTMMAQVSLPRVVCICNAYFTHLFHLAVCFWTNALYLDMAWTFSGAYRSHSRDKEAKKFSIYFVYAWGCPIIICAVTLVMGYVNGIPDTYIKPHISKKSCWFRDIKAMWAYHYGIVAFLGIVNFPLLAFVAIKIIIELCRTDIVRKNRNGGILRSKSKTRLIIYLNLAFVIGPPRILLTLQFFSSTDTLSFAVDVLLNLRSLGLFLFVCCKRNTARLISKRFQSIWRKFLVYKKDTHGDNVTQDTQTTPNANSSTTETNDCQSTAL